MDNTRKPINPFDRHRQEADSPEPGRPHAIRALHWGERISIFRHLSRMGPAGLRQLFGHDPRPDMIHRHAESINLNRDIAIGAFADGQLRGCAIARGYSDAGRHAALCSASVEASHEGRGIGAELMRAVIEQAKLRGVHKLRASARSDNLAGSRLAAKTMPQARLEGEAISAELECLPESLCPKIERSRAEGIETLRLRPTGACAGRVLLAHGEGGDAWIWRAKVMPELAALGIDSMAISLPGHGSSEAGNRDVDGLLRLLEAAAQSMGPGTAICAQSLAALAATRLLWREAPPRLALIGCPADPSDPRAGAGAWGWVRRRSELPESMLGLARILEAAPHLGAPPTAAPSASFLCVESPGSFPLAMQISAARSRGAAHDTIDGGEDPMRAAPAAQLAAWIAQKAVRA